MQQPMKRRHQFHLRLLMEVAAATRPVPRLVAQARLQGFREGVQVSGKVSIERQAAEAQKLLAGEIKGA